MTEIILTQTVFWFLKLDCISREVIAFEVNQHDSNMIKESLMKTKSCSFKSTSAIFYTNLTTNDLSYHLFIDSFESLFVVLCSARLCRLRNE